MTVSPEGPRASVLIVGVINLADFRRRYSNRGRGETETKSGEQASWRGKKREKPNFLMPDRPLKCCVRQKKCFNNRFIVCRVLTQKNMNSN